MITNRTTMTKIAIILGSTRPNRNGAAVAQWVLEQARARSTADYELVDLADVALPFLDEPVSPMLGRYEHDHTRAWGARIAPFDGFVFVTPEYNHSFPAVLKNALDFLFAEWNDKAAGIVSYGGSGGGARAAEQLRLVLAELRVASVQASVALSFRSDFEHGSVFTPAVSQEAALSATLDQVESWSRAFQPVRAVSAA
jgi:NAD(P)H-dependent FMN reductase